MSEVAEIIAELKSIHDGEAWHGPSLKENLSGVSAIQAAAKPISGAHSIWELTTHIAAWEEVFLRRLEGYPTTEPEGGNFPPVGETNEAAWLSMLQRLDRVHEKLLAHISTLTEDRLNETVAGKDYNVGYLLRGIMLHQVYHSGQIAMLKKI
jgi:uncharacterized damage-inducible protein DinB